ncbi:hypothetical protein [Acidihalobacter yilgarnensis]|nr:hypothetical protein [Acidihalobacter yilgarnensis]
MQRRDQRAGHFLLALAALLEQVCQRRFDSAQILYSRARTSSKG